jgi:hypothetical protein
MIVSMHVNELYCRTCRSSLRQRPKTIKSQKDAQVWNGAVGIVRERVAGRVGACVIVVGQSWCSRIAVKRRNVTSNMLLQSGRSESQSYHSVEKLGLTEHVFYCSSLLCVSNKSSTANVAKHKKMVLGISKLQLHQRSRLSHRQKSRRS